MNQSTFAFERLTVCLSYNQNRMKEKVSKANGSLDGDMETRPPPVVGVSGERVEVCACGGGGSVSRTAVKPAGKMM